MTISLISRLSIAAALPGFFIFGSISNAATLAAAYTFSGNLNAQEGGVAALTAVDPLGNNGFVTDTVFGSSRTVYSFNGNTTPAQQAGLTFNDSSNLISPSSYSLEIVFDLANVSGYRRLVDTQNRASDNGLYNLGGGLSLYPSANNPAAGFANNTYADLIFTDNGTSVSAYVNGVLQFTIADSQLNLNNANNPSQFVNLFLDNTAGGGQGEYSSGNIALFEAFDGVLSQSDVTALSANPFANTGSSTSTPEPTSSALALGGVLLLIAAAVRNRRSC